MEEHPGTSARRAAQQLGHKRKTVRKTLKEEGFFPYQISELHELKPEDYSPSYDYCDWFFNKFGRNVETMSTIFFSDEAGFHLSGYVNSQNYRIWLTNNPHGLRRNFPAPNQSWSLVRNFSTLSHWANFLC